MVKQSKVPKTFLLSGDICHPGLVSIRANNLQEALKKVERREFVIEDEQDRPEDLYFHFDGNVFNEDLEVFEENINDPSLYDDNGNLLPG